MTAEVPATEPNGESPVLDLRQHLTRHFRVPNAVPAQDVAEGSEVWVNFGVNYYEHSRVLVLATLGAHGLIGRIVGGVCSARAQILGATPGRRVRFLRGHALQAASGWAATGSTRVRDGQVDST